jgi:hypothetical protein
MDRSKDEDPFCQFVAVWASAQALTFANLEGVKITIELVTAMLVQREGF